KSPPPSFAAKASRSSVANRTQKRPDAARATSQSAAENHFADSYSSSCIGRAFYPVRSCPASKSSQNRRYHDVYQRRIASFCCRIRTIWLHLLYPGLFLWYTAFHLLPPGWHRDFFRGLIFFFQCSDRIEP